MDIEGIDRLYQSARSDFFVKEEEDRRKKAAEQEKLDETRRELTQIIEQKVQDSSAAERFELAQTVWKNPSKVIPISMGQISPEVANLARMRILLLAVQLGHKEALEQIVYLVGNVKYAVCLTEPERKTLAVAAWMWAGLSQSAPAADSTIQAEAKYIIEWLEKGAAKKDPDSIFALAEAYFLGRGVQKDVETSFKLHTIAAALGHLDARARSLSIAKTRAELNVPPQTSTLVLTNSTDSTVSLTDASLVDASKNEAPPEQPLVSSTTSLPAGFDQLSKVTAILERVESLESRFVNSLGRMESLFESLAREREKLDAASVLISQQPVSLGAEIDELRSLLKNTARQVSMAEPVKIPPGIRATGLAPLHTSLPEFLHGLIEIEEISLAELRRHLLPLDLLPSAVIESINEMAFDLVGEAALEEDGERVIVYRQVLVRVLETWDTLSA